MKQKLVFLSMLLGLAACGTLKTSSEYLTRGNGYLKDGKKQAAIDAYNKAVVLNPNNVDVYEARGAAYYFNGQYALAARDFERVLNENPQRVPAYTAYASVLAAQGDFSNALKLLNAADQLRPGNAETYFARAGVYFMLGKYDLAVADYTRTYELRPAADVLNARGAAYAKWGKAEQARQDFEAAKTPNLPQYINAYAFLE